ncbi:hypothetical protein A9Q99_22800 [Gammaproteobacteria bacterium 45_16_T64]|nr:hypothetical protein A9Q99_22800 [Gammaproteobacteria bacterium 45_16_T64]
MLDAIVSKHQLQKIALEGFDMALEGELEAANTVFEGLAAIAPTARATLVGQSLVTLLRANQNRSSEPPRSAVMDSTSIDDNIVRCCQGLLMLQQGNSHAAQALWQQVLTSGAEDSVVDSVAVSLAQACLHNELDHHGNMVER